MDAYQKVLNQALKHYILEAVFFLIVVFVVVVILVGLIKKKILPKWTICILSIAVLIFVLGSIRPINIYRDINNESYIVYHGNYKQRHEGYNDSYYQTTLLDDEEIDLLSHFTLTSNTGEYYGYVVYGEHSKIVVYVGETPPDQK